MPWTANDADSHTQEADDPKLKRQWAEIADSELREGREEGDAIKIANGVVKRQKAKKSACEDLIDIAKGFATESKPSMQYTVRRYKRINSTKRNGNYVRPHRQRRFTNPAQMRGIKNVEDV